MPTATQSMSPTTRSLIEVRSGIYEQFKELIDDRLVVDVATEIVNQFLDSRNLQEKVALTAGLAMYANDQFEEITPDGPRNKRVEVRAKVFEDYRSFVKPWKIAEVSSALFRVFIEDRRFRRAVFRAVDED